MAPKFGTSGLRGLVSELEPDLISQYIQAFVLACPIGTAIFVGRDLRPSSPRIAANVIAAARATGCDVVDCGALPTPALARVAMTAGAAAVMVTGSHIPADRNGLKFYLPTGEITKADETTILHKLGASAPSAPHPGTVTKNLSAEAEYTARYLRAFGAGALSGLRLGVYQHSSVGRDLLSQTLEALGATTVALARSEGFVPVDTEAVPAETRIDLAAWAKAHNLDAVLSTDGDADRPLMTDGSGKVIAGDVLGVLTAQALGAEVVCTPVSSNSMVQQLFSPRAVHLTRVGSPHVIAAMERVLAEDSHARVVGFEANGGFLLGFQADAASGPLDALMTRDAFLPLIAPLVAARKQQRTLAQICEALPQRVTATDRLENMPSEAGLAFLSRLTQNAKAREHFLSPLGAEVAVDLTDGLRISLEMGRILHLRPSGNAPEFRVYVEATSEAEARNLLDRALRMVKIGLANN